MLSKDHDAEHVKVQWYTERPSLARTLPLLSIPLIFSQRREILPITIPHPPIQVHRLDHRAEPLGPLGAPLPLTNRLDRVLIHLVRRALRVLDVEDGLARVDEGREDAALVVLGALLVDGKVDKLDDLGDDVAGVLEPDGELVLGGLVGEEAYKGDGVGTREVLAVFVLLGSGC